MVRAEDIANWPSTTSPPKRSPAHSKYLIYKDIIAKRKSC